MHRGERDGESAYFFPIERASERSADNVLVALDVNQPVENECCHDRRDYIMLCKESARSPGFRFRVWTLVRNGSRELLCSQHSRDRAVVSARARFDKVGVRRGSGG